MVDADFNFKMPKIEMTEQSEDGSMEDLSLNLSKEVMDLRLVIL